MKENLPILLLAMALNTFWGFSWKQMVGSASGAWFMIAAGVSACFFGLLWGVFHGSLRTPPWSTLGVFAAVMCLTPVFFATYSFILSKHLFSSAYAMIATGTAVGAILIDVISKQPGAWSWRKCMGVIFAVITIWLIRGGSPPK